MMIFQHRDTEIQSTVYKYSQSVHHRTSVLLLILLMTPILGMAQVTEINGIYYKLDNSAKTAEVTYKNYTGNDYAGAVMIPSTVTYGDVSYSVTSIGYHAFYKCSGLTSISIPNSVTSLGDGVFYYCSGVTSISIPNSVTSLGDEVFYYCSGLTSITIPSSVTSIGSATFAGCSSLTSIIVDSNNPVYDSRNNCNAIIMTSTNELIGGCQKTIIPNSVTSIGYKAFQFCFSLKSINIPNSVTSIGEYAFWNCYFLASITISQSVKTISSSSFACCHGVTSIKVDAANPYYDSRNNCNAIIETSSDKLLVGCENTVIPTSVTSIGDYAFTGFTGTTINIPNSVTIIGQAAFWGCRNLTFITIPNSVTSIGKSAFHDCSNLKSITIPDGVTSIEYATFDGCKNLTSIIMPNSVTSIGESAFLDCSSLTSINIPNSVTSIGMWAFLRCSSLTSINIPNSVSRIDGSAFEKCTSLTSIKVDSNNTVYDSRNNCNAIIITSTNELLIGCQNTIIPNSVTSIDGLAFAYCTGLTSIIIPKSVETIGWGAFEYCESLTSVTVENPVPVKIDNNTFSNRTNATLYVPRGSKSAYQAADYWREFKEIIETEIASNDILGDVNNDGVVNIADVQCIFSWLLENKPSVFIESAADFNQDGTISVSDGVAIIASLLGGQAPSRIPPRVAVTHDSSSR